MSSFRPRAAIVRAVEGLSFHVDPGEIVAIVGKSGSGKSVSALSIMRLLPRHTGKIPKGRVIFDGRDLLMLYEEQMRELRGRDISMIFQEPMTSLNPILTIGLQITEPLPHSSRHERRTGARRARSSCSVWSAFPIRRAGSNNIRISFPAACASA